MKITLTRKQWRFVDSASDETLFGGAAGGGKSYGIVINALLYALSHVGSRQLVLRRTLPELQRSILITAQRLFPAKLAAYSSSQNLWRFANGSLIEFGYCDHEGDVMKYQSAEYDCLYFDELTHFTHYQYSYLLSRLRGVNGFPQQVKCATNPGGVGHFWVRERFVLPQHGEQPVQHGKRSRLFIPARVYDNTFLMRADLDYVERLRELPDIRRRALLEGDWDLFAGQFFPEYRLDLHGMRPFAIPGSWRRFVSIDWGYNDPCAVLWHAVADGHVYTYREMYVRQMTASAVALEIKRLSGAEKIDYYVASPDMWQKRGADSVYGENIKVVFLPYGKKAAIPRNAGATTSWRTLAIPGAVTTAISEGSTPDGLDLTIGKVSGTVKQYGAWTKISDYLDMTGLDPLLTEVAEMFGEHAAISVDKIIATVLLGGSNVYYPNKKTSRASLTASDVITSADIVAARRIMVENNVPMLQLPNGARGYVAFAHPETVSRLMSEQNGPWASFNSGSAEGLKAFQQGEAGQMYGIYFIETTVLGSFTNSSLTGKNTIILGADAFGVPDVAGPVKPEILVFGDGSTENPMALYKTVAWKTCFAAVRLDEKRILRIESIS